MRYFNPKLALCFFLLSIGAIASPTVTKNLGEEELAKQLNVTAVIQGQDTDSLTDVDKNTNSKKTSSFQFNTDNYEDMSIYNYIVNYDTVNNKKNYKIDEKDKNKQVSFLSDNVSIHEAKLKAEQEALDKALANNKADELVGQTIYMSGYCYTNNAIEIEEVQGYAILDCTFEENDLKIESSKMMAMFVPLATRSALISKPIYMQKGNKKLPITTGVVLTIDRTSMNVANFINDKKIKLMASSLVSQSGDVLLENSVNYMEQKEKSQTTQDIRLNSTISGTTTTSATNTQSPDVSTYLATAGIQLFSTVLKGLGTLMSEDKYPLFKVYEQSGFYVDFMIEIDEKNKKVLNYMSDSYETYNKETTNGGSKLKLPSVK